nr:MAG TPA: hypothetical protein [Caudoviricetes sp.]
MLVDSVKAAGAIPVMDMIAGKQPGQQVSILRA